jgi:hypothetical protein
VIAGTPGYFLADNRRSGRLSTDGFMSDAICIKIESINHRRIVSHSESSDEEGRHGKHETSFSGAAEYRQLSDIIPPPVVADGSPREVYQFLDNERLNALALREASQAVTPMFTAPDDPMREHEMELTIGIVRRDLAMEALAHFTPHLATEAEKSLVYNMARYARDTTVDRSAYANEALFTERLQSLESSTFGPEGPEFVTKARALRREEGVFDWHGQPIQLFLGVSSQDRRRPKGTPDFQLSYRSTYSYGEEGDAELPLEWHLKSWRGDHAVVPPEGLTLGREMPILSKTREQLHPLVSRQHLKLVPQDDGSIQITDFSTNGTEVREGYWQKRQQAV